jgi:hypothetical protein
VGGTRRAVAVVLVHVLLAALAVGAAAVWGAGDDPALAGQRVTVPDPDPRLPDNPEAVAVVRPPGLLVVDSATVKHGSSPAALGGQEADVLTDAGVVVVKAFVGRDGRVTAGVWQMSVRDGDDPHDALRAIDTLYAEGGWLPEVADTRGVLVRSQEPDGRQPYAGYRAHYVRGPHLIRIEAYGTEQAEVDRAFADLARRQLAAWPPR